MAINHPSPTQAYHPTTFRERGVAAPFTTPMLGGARIRASVRDEMEIVLPNPAGGRGAYIFNWASVRERCRPTLHDTVLFERIIRGGTPDPLTVRTAALSVAQEGLAGRAARAAAETAIAADKKECIRAEYLLTMRLLHQADPAARAPSNAAELEQRSTMALQALAPGFGCTALRLRDVLAYAAADFAPNGIRAEEKHSRIVQLTALLQATRELLRRPPRGLPDTRSARLIDAIAAPLELALLLTRQIVDDLRRLLADPVELLTRCFADPVQTRGLALRPDWVLDGWERTCLLFRHAKSPADRRVALLEMVHVIPALPREVNSWIGRELPPNALEPSFRVVTQDEGTRGGSAAVALVARNEALRAHTL